MGKDILRKLGMVAVVIVGSLVGVSKLEQNIQEKSKLLIDVAEKMIIVGDSWENVYTKLGKEQEYLIKYSNGHKKFIVKLSKKEMKQYLKLPSTVLL